VGRKTVNNQPINYYRIVLSKNSKENSIKTIEQNYSKWNPQIFGENDQVKIEKKSLKKVFLN
jgi:hypothetical protein